MKNDRCLTCGKESRLKSGLQPLVIIGVPGGFCSTECIKKYPRPANDRAKVKAILENMTPIGRDFEI